MEAIAEYEPLLVKDGRTGPQIQRIERKIGHAQAVRVGRTLYITGAVRWGQNDKSSAADEMKEKIHSTFGDIRQMLEVHGADVSDIVKETVYTKNLDAAIEAEAARSELYGDHTPTAKWVGVSKLLYPELLIEIGIVAIIP